MSTVSVTPSKRKIIDLKDDTFKTLSIMAIQKGTNLKNYIEDILNILLFYAVFVTSPTLQRITNVLKEYHRNK